MTRYVPNILSFLRIILAVLLIPTLTVKIIFVALYITIGITDVLDGLIARKFGYESDLGAKLDSIADLVFYSIVVFIFVKQFFSILGTMHQVMLMVIIFIRFLNMFLTKLKYKSIVFVHTFSNKVSGLIVYIIPIVFLFTRASFVVWFILMIIFIAAAEELMITIKYKEPNLNRRSIFFK